MSNNCNRDCDRNRSRDRDRNRNRNSIPNPIANQTGQKFACKQLKLNRVTPRYVRKLYQEIAIMRELDHPHIVKLRCVTFRLCCVFCCYCSH